MARPALTRARVAGALVVSGVIAVLTWQSTAHGHPEIASQPGPPPARWCAMPQPDEPLLRDAHDVLRRRGTLGDAAWFHGVVGADDAVVVIADEQVCREAARAYGGEADGAVLVIQVGDIYLVDDQRPRQGADAFWHVNVLDAQLKPTIFAYGGGA